MKGTTCLLLVSALLICATAGYAAQPDREEGTLSKPLRVTVESSDVTIDVNDIEMFVTNIGVFAYDKTKSLGVYDGLYYPKGTDKTVIYDAGLWIGGKVNGEIRMAIGAYAQEWQPGTMKSIPGPFTGNWADYYNDSEDPRFKVYKISLGDDATTNPDYANWPFEDGAPYVDENGNGQYDVGEPPLILGDQTLWTVFNDADPTRHSDSAGLTDPLGLEVQMTTFGFKRTGALGNVVFIKYLLQNKGPNTIDSTFVALWADPDLGGAGDDLVGSDTELSLGFCYNATNNDYKYGSKPPAVGFDFFKSPIGDDGVELPMTAFNRYINGTDPRNKNHTWDYMKGLDAVAGGGAPYVDPTTGQVTTYAMSGDPVTGAGWLDDNAADRRYMLCSGPFTMAPGDTQEVVAAVIVGQSVDRLTSVTMMKFYDTYAQSAFDRNFILPDPPESPVVTAASMDSEIILTWDTNSEEQSGDYSFEGYNIYQGRSAIGPWKRIATYDVNNGTGIIFDNRIDEATGLVINKPVQYGSDSELRRFIRITEDAWRGSSLQNGMNYYFAVTAYGYDPIATPKTLESQINVLGRQIVDPATGETEFAPGLVPRTPWPEVAYDTTRVFGYEFPVTHVAGISDGQVVPLVIDPTQLTGHDYRVIFREALRWDPELEEEVPIDVWDLIDVTTSTTVLTDQTNQSGDEDYPIVDGLQVKVMGPPFGVKDWDYSDTRWFSWVDFGGTGFGGAVGLGVEFFGSTLTPADYRTVEIRFSNAPAQWSNCKVYRRDEGYAVQAEFGTFPGSAWDVDSDPPRRLNICFVEMHTDEKPANLTWDPDNSNTGGREYLFIMNSDYNEAVDYDNDNWGPGADVQYAYWGRLRGTHPFLETQGTWTLYPNYVNTPNDVFEFTTTAAGMLPLRYGDVSLNGIVRPYDASLVLQYSVGSIMLTDDQLTVAEVSGNGSVTEYDASLILQFAAGVIPDFPVGLFVEKRIVALPRSGSGALRIGRASLSDSSKIYLPVYLENASGIVSSHFVLHFNHDGLKPLKVSTTSFTEGYTMVFNPRKGEVEVALAGTVPLAGMGALVVLIFEVDAGAVAESEFSLTLSDIRLNERSFETIVLDTDTVIPGSFGLHQNYPNPFNSETTISYSLPVNSYVVLRIYNMTGQLVRSLIDTHREAGQHQVLWDGKDNRGVSVSSGVYFYRLSAETYISTRKMLVSK